MKSINLKRINTVKNKKKKKKKKKKQHLHNLGQLRSGTYVVELEEDPSECPAHAGKTM